MTSQKNISDSINKLLESKLTKYVDSKIDSVTCSSIYVDVFDTLVNVFKNSNIQISNEAVNLLAQIYYDTISINDNSELDPNIFDRKAKLDDVSTKELALLAVLYRGSPFYEIFVYEIKKRT